MLLEYFIFLCYNVCSFYIALTQNFVCEMSMYRLAMYSEKRRLLIMKTFVLKKSHYKIYVTQFTNTTTL